MNRFIRHLDEWAFGPTTATALAVFRILFGTIAFLSLLVLGLEWTTWYGPYGLAPGFSVARWAGGAPRFSLLFGSESISLIWGVWALTTLAALATAVGLGTRVATVLLAMGLVTLHHRNPFILHSGDTLMRVGAIWLVFAPCGRTLSLDQRIRQYLGRPALSPWISVWPQRVLELQLALVYLTTVYLKLQGFTWRDGTATWYAAQLPEFNRFPAPGFIDLPPFTQIFTYGTLLVEVALGTVALAKWGRRWSIIGGLMLHAVIEYRFNIPFFAATITSFYVLYYSGPEWEARLAQWGRKRTVTPGPGMEGTTP